MSMQQPPQNPYSQQVPPAGNQPQGHAPQFGAPVPAGQPKRPIDKGILRQLIFGAVLVVGFEIVTGILGLLSNAIYGFYGTQFSYFIVSVVAAAVFAGLVLVSALYIAPLEKARGTVEVLKKLALGGAIGLVGLIVINIIWAVVTGGSYLGQAIFSSGFVGSISTAIVYTALFALGVLIARTVAPRPRAAAPQYGAPQQAYGAPQQQGQAPQGYAAPQQGQGPQVYPQQHQPQQQFPTGQQPQQQFPTGQQPQQPQQPPQP
ncbi:hypothetical protein L1277_002491 [Okibacterium sp. HSC-33S16]|uniref:hypothetical protein n=1 Tax=Okibacterium sp. HSC-33S16 TaxID=2910965 RepID=UPI00209D026D|nr:hypothetical protein [Okibacterium sp. HSC-33S16]MCP2032388.1 hypothetical protein [Okibacterium sp. HSC-33S16]